jgi:RNA polymerase sigma-70 factor (ECF subfamily)
MKKAKLNRDQILLEDLLKESPRSDYAFDEIFNTYSSRLNAYCLFKSGNRSDAEEIFEDTWLKFLDRIRNGKKVDSILPYLYTIARTLAIDRYRKKKSRRNLEVELFDISELENFGGDNDILDDLENEELISLVKIAVNSLDDKYKEAFVLNWFGGVSYKEISSILDISHANAKMRCHRAMKEILKILKPYYIKAE